MTEDDSTNKIAKLFVWLAWIIAIALLMYFFQGVLDKQYNPNSQPQVSLNSSGQAEVVLQQNKQGHYVTLGSINESPVTFLLDTGATQVSIPAHIADELQLESFGSYPVRTANGTVTVYKTQIDQLSIGNIFLYNVAAHINPAMKSDAILLGMSALKEVEFSQKGKQLTLREYR
ncbi:TIGR02281 family clan AA aspartic protease [Colwellia sp. 4_MG-2023]|jgi:aspartyl protease family protein|uniref:retropepsin-like aspartic protease family protein n=1 Tax=unclassified Colwellia TaxID=196834 RepID=UPI001C08D9C0|nr:MULTISPECIES: TIGR02281 family clan AA aspartic protease [unclassified Colwellia]MBU2925392.1 TIGR02281 family clan AA aspartic protease [Colwellia sp. C2M11]MDO6489488.1 TIGR02281 family clan AA aspartic protease [Colwellia sp. 6_MG-2023]MDO6506025.1 TIGR02281 family clan AA aspartic protease [Colwellia sp. 5_MG-2023]MDO6554915.1 TIGR02281 family clan AA aspartic protease [Colwellia sp. 4_MG-2023]MDO6653478.1 TIGR02281 family clan AA aspartic protease [Colwellia sp. 3_MG-2023]